MKHTTYWLASMMMLMLACGSAPTELPPVERDGVVAAGSSRGPDSASTPADLCANHATGCPCDVEGDAVECGIVRQQFGDYVRCTPGFRVCHEGAWGECATDRVVGPH